MNTLVNRIIELSCTQPDKDAVAFKKEVLSYRDMAYFAAGMSEILKEYDIEKGDRISYTATSKPESLVLYLAIHMAGAVAVFLDKNGTAENILRITEIAGSKLLLTDKIREEGKGSCRILSMKDLYLRARERASLIKDLNAYRIDPEDNELSELLFTSGTTGQPKGVKLSYKSVYHILQNTIDGIGIREDDRLLMPLPLNHSFALRVVRAVLYSGATLVLQNGFTFATDLEKNIAAHGCNALACVPASYEVIKGQMQEHFSRVLGDLRFIEFGAGALSVRQRHEITSLIPKVRIYNTWGSSESGGAIFCNVSEVVQKEEYAGALGKPLEGRVSVKILDENGHEMQSDETHPGRMALKGDMQMTGYWKDEETTSKTLVDGWLITGDMAYLKDGYVFMLGRADHIINVGGEKVSPVEVENVAGQFAGIRECACIGVKDPEGVLGQVPALFMSASSDVTEEEIRKYLAEQMERYKVPTIYRFIDRLPRNRNQKVDYRELKRIYDASGDTELLNPVVRTILSRRSIRNFTDREIPADILDMILKCGYYAPSGHNMQSWRFTVLTKGEDIFALKEAAALCAKEHKVVMHGFENPKVLVLISNDKRNQDGCQDASCAAENMMLAARSYGIGSVWINALMTLRDKPPVKELLDGYGIPDNHVIWAMVALGYHESEGVLLQKKEDVISFV